MYQNTKKYKCGGCGNENYHLYNEDGNAQRILAECTSCKSITEISVTPSKIDLNWGDNASGIMCIF